MLRSAACAGSSDVRRSERRIYSFKRRRELKDERQNAIHTIKSLKNHTSKEYQGLSAA
jgi:hypothetical protein